MITIKKVITALQTESRQDEAEYFTIDLGNNITLDMVSIPGGKFLMGSPNNEEGHQNRESPQHEVTISPFFMGKYSITQEQWQAVMGNNPSFFKGAIRPVEQVSWDDCVAFCEKLSQKTKFDFRLPSEAQWEYACRAGTTTPFHFGETITTDLANYNGNDTYSNAPKGIYREKTTNVGSFSPNAFGLYDMHGNVWEWCGDNWHKNYENTPKKGEIWLDNNSSKFVLRGGSWCCNPVYCRCAFRGREYVVNRNYDFIFGFRVVCGGVRTL